MTDEAFRTGAAEAPVSSVEFAFQLFLSDQEPPNRETAQSLGKLLDHRLGGRYVLDVVDVSREPGRAREAGVLATPTLLRTHPAPPRQLVGDLYASEELLDQLGLPEP